MHIPPEHNIADIVMIKKLGKSFLRKRLFAENILWHRSRSDRIFKTSIATSLNVIPSNHS